MLALDDDSKENHEMLDQIIKKEYEKELEKRKKK